MTDSLIRIGFLTERLILGYGVDLVVDQQARGLLAAGAFAVTVYAQKISELYDRAPYRLVALTPELGITGDLESEEFARTCTAFLSQEPIDLWIIHTPPFYEWKDLLPGPIILWEHGTPPGTYHQDRGRGLQLEWSRRVRYRTIFNQLYPHQKLVVISEYIKSCLYEPARGEAVVIYNGADHYPLASDAQAATLRASLGIKADELMVLSISRLAFDYDDQPYKGIHDLLAWFPDLFAHLPKKVKVVIAGRGNPADAPKLTARGVIPFLNVAKESMPALYRAADLYVCPSRWEGFNLPAVEAQFQGTPVAALAVGSHKEVIAPQLLLVNDLKALKQKLVALTTAADLKALGQQAQQAVARFTWDANGAALLKVITDLGEASSTDRHGLPLDQRSTRRSPKSLAEWSLLIRHISMVHGRNHLLKLGLDRMIRLFRER